eukprot:6186517-Prymnesium_polylepis.1
MVCGRAARASTRRASSCARWRAAPTSCAPRASSFHRRWRLLCGSCERGSAWTSCRCSLCSRPTHCRSSRR